MPREVSRFFFLDTFCQFCFYWVVFKCLSEVNFSSDNRVGLLSDQSDSLIQMYSYKELKVIVLQNFFS